MSTQNSGIILQFRLCLRHWMTGEQKTEEIAARNWNEAEELWIENNPSQEFSVVAIEII